MNALVYVRLVGYSAGTLLHLFIVVLVAGYRRPRGLERVLFFLALALFLFYAGLLLEINSEIYYSTPPPETLAFAAILVGLGLTFLPPLLVHLHAAYWATLRGGWPAWLRGAALAAYLPVVYFLATQSPRLMDNLHLEFLRPGAVMGRLYGLWLVAAQVGCLVSHRVIARQVSDARQRRLHQAMTWFFALAAPLVGYVYVLGGPRDAAWSAAVSTAVLLAALVPSALFGYSVVRYNFLGMGGQRNLLYAVSAAFLALLYLSVVRRVEMWLDPPLPPEATAAILLFTLVVFFEPLQRKAGRLLRHTFQMEVDRLQRLSGEIQGEARRGELGRLVNFAERRIREEFELAAVRIRLCDRTPAGDSPIAEGGGRFQSFPLREGGKEIGALEAAPFGAFLSGETYAALEFLAEQLPGILDLCRLIEEKLTLERELAERERLALVGQMAASISHNLKNPLGSMKTLLQVQLENPDLPESLRGDCALVVAEIDRLSAKLNQLLRYAKPPVRAGAAPQRVAAVALAEQMVALLGHEAQRRAVRLEFEREPEETFVRGTEEALSDVLSNLLVNAIEVLPAGGNMQLRLARRNAALEIEVTDDGPGIPAEFRSKIFQPFFTTKPSGTGLGLAIVERRLAEMDGSIRWQSPVREGRGTRFTVTLPVAE